MGKVAFFFAGQGAQYVGMGKALYEASPAAKAAFDAAERIRPGTMEQCFSGDMETLSITINTQPCLFTVDYACAAALLENGVAPDMLAGFSLGEVAAVAFNGMLSFEDAFNLVIKRAQWMQQCAKKNPGAMGAVLRLEQDKVEALCSEFVQVYPVNYNCPGQIVVSGSESEMGAFESAVAEAGGRFMKLKVSGSFHSPFMDEAADQLYEYMQGLCFQAPRWPLYANATAEPYEGDARALLAKQVKSPVFFQKSVERMVQDGLQVAIEVGAGKTLTGLIKKIGGIEHVLNVEDAQTLLEAVRLLKEKELC